MKHFGITLGPLSYAGSFARSTHQRWMASFMFSWIAHRIVEQLRDRGATIVSPSPAFLNDPDFAKGVGCYSDRILFSLTGSRKDIERLIETVKDDFVDRIIHVQRAFGDPEPPPGLRQSFRETLYGLVCEHDVFDIQILNNKLDVLEQSPPFQCGIVPDREDHFLSFFSETYLTTAKLRFWNEYAGIQSIPAISKKSFLAYPKDEKADKPTYEPKTSHYYAVIYADGDKVGSLISGLKDARAIETVSGALLTFASASAEAVRSYGALPIYFGGDDMLFIAPLVTKWKGNDFATIFDLIEDLDKVFRNEIVLRVPTLLKDVDQEHPISTDACSMSYGISIQYVKHPLNRAVDASWAALMRAKKWAAEYTGDESRNGNAVAVSLRLHSGRYASFVLPKALENMDMAYSAFLHGQRDERALRSLHQKVMAHFATLRWLLDHEQADRIRHWCDNTFDEDIHLENKDDLQQPRGGGVFQDQLRSFERLILACGAVFTKKADDVSTEQDPLYGWMEGAFRLARLYVEREALLPQEEAEEVVS